MGDQVRLFSSLVLSGLVMLQSLIFCVGLRVTVPDGDEFAPVTAALGTVLVWISEVRSVTSPIPAAMADPGSALQADGSRVVRGLHHGVMLSSCGRPGEGVKQAVILTVDLRGSTFWGEELEAAQHGPDSAKRTYRVITPRGFIPPEIHPIRTFGGFIRKGRIRRIQMEGSILPDNTRIDPLGNKRRMHAWGNNNPRALNAWNNPCALAIGIDAWICALAKGKGYGKGNMKWRMG